MISNKQYLNIYVVSHQELMKKNPSIIQVRLKLYNMTSSLNSLSKTPISRFHGHFEVNIGSIHSSFQLYGILGNLHIQIF